MLKSQKLGISGLSVFLVIASSAPAFAMPLGNFTDLKVDRAVDQAVDWESSIPEALPGTVDFTAIVALNDCSGSIVRFDTSADTDPAVVLTNGHCLDGGFLKPGEVVLDQPVSRDFELLSRDGSQMLGVLRADRVVYSTMTKTDITIYRLTQTYADILRNYGIAALTLSSEHSTAGRSIAIASGYWRKIYSCNIDQFIPELKESDWTWQDSIRYSQPGCEIIGGTSGSPVIDTETHQMIGINNTTNENGRRCTLDNPCEVDSSGHITVNRHAGYGQETYLIYGCLNAKNEFDLGQPTCELPKP